MELAISYTRFSSTTQAKGRSERRQDDETEAYCARKGHKIIETFVDRAVSAYTGENSDKGDLKAILDLTAAGKIKPGTHLVVESLDRISRQEMTAALSLFLNIINLRLAIDTTFDGQIYTKERCDANEISFRAGHAEAIPLPENSVDVALSFTVMEEGDGDRMLAELVRVTKPGGRVAVIVRAVDMPSWVNLPLSAAMRAKADLPGMVSGGVAAAGCADTSLYRRFRSARLTRLSGQSTRALRCQGTRTLKKSA